MSDHDDLALLQVATAELARDMKEVLGIVRLAWMVLGVLNLIRFVHAVAGHHWGTAAFAAVCVFFAAWAWRGADRRVSKYGSVR